MPRISLSAGMDSRSTLPLDRRGRATFPVFSGPRRSDARP